MNGIPDIIDKNEYILSHKDKLKAKEIILHALKTEDNSRYLF
ncbi:MAG: hypothetical protein R2771_12730 [Saprospiraceae bacterium]